MKNYGLSVATNFDDRLLEAISAYPVTEVFGKREKDIQCGQAELLPHEPRFDYIVENKVDGHESSRCQHSGACPQLDKSKHCRNGGDA